MVWLLWGRAGAASRVEQTAANVSNEILRWNDISESFQIANTLEGYPALVAS
jgi:hypothetical protein